MVAGSWVRAGRQPCQHRGQVISSRRERQLVIHGQGRHTSALPDVRGPAAAAVVRRRRAAASCAISNKPGHGDCATSATAAHTTPSAPHAAGQPTAPRQAGTRVPRRSRGQRLLPLAFSPKHPCDPRPRPRQAAPPCSPAPGHPRRGQAHGTPQPRARASSRSGQQLRRARRHRQGSRRIPLNTPPQRSATASMCKTHSRWRPATAAGGNTRLGPRARRDAAASLHPRGSTRLPSHPRARAPPPSPCSRGRPPSAMPNNRPRL